MQNSRSNLWRIAVSENNNSENNTNPDPFDFDFDNLNTENVPENKGSSFDMDNPFPEDSATVNLAEESGADESATEESEGVSPEAAPIGVEKADKKKKGFWGSKEKNPKEKAVKEKKEKVPAGETAPRDWGTILCIAFSAFLLASLLVFNIAAFATSGKSMMQTLCFLGAVNIVGLALAAVPILFYKFPKERTLPNVMLGISVVALFSGVLMLVTEFYRYDFILKP
jgi:hypothetical protein